MKLRRMFGCFGASRRRPVSRSTTTTTSRSARPAGRFGIRGHVAEGVRMERRIVTDEELRLLLPGDGDETLDTRSPVFTEESVEERDYVIPAARFGLDLTDAQLASPFGEVSDSSRSIRFALDMTDTIRANTFGEAMESLQPIEERLHDAMTRLTDDALEETRNMLRSLQHTLDLSSGIAIDESIETARPGRSSFPSHLSELQITLLPDWKTSPKECDRNCTICLENFVEGSYVRTLPCFHFFHADCIDVWLRAHNNCPFCIRSVLPGTA